MTRNLPPSIPFRFLSFASLLLVHISLVCFSLPTTRSLSLPSFSFFLSISSFLADHSSLPLPLYRLFIFRYSFLLYRLFLSIFPFGFRIFLFTFSKNNVAKSSSFFSILFLPSSSTSLFLYPPYFFALFSSLLAFDSPFSLSRSFLFLLLSTG